MILPLGLHVLRKACAQVREWQRGGLHEHLGVSVNLSGKQFSNQRLVEETKRVLDETQLNPAFLHLEITETVIMENAATATDMLQRLKDIGIQLSIDDFGTGYSSLSYLHQFPFDILKVDRSFVSRMTFDRNSKSIVETILILAKKLNKRVVAEGIETAEQLAQLKEINCDFGQGFLFSQPLPAAEIVRLLNLQDQNNSGYDAPLDAVITKATDVDTYAM
jgi:EAL domain-containing protein (putative c-di-GMP-specific phosphodiesterase class I)